MLTKWPRILQLHSCKPNWAALLQAQLGFLGFFPITLRWSWFDHIVSSVTDQNNIPPKWNHILLRSMQKWLLDFTHPVEIVQILKVTQTSCSERTLWRSIRLPPERSGQPVASFLTGQASRVRDVGWSQRVKHTGRETAHIHLQDSCSSGSLKARLLTSLGSILVSCLLPPITTNPRLCVYSPRSPVFLHFITLQML